MKKTLGALALATAFSVFLLAPAATNAAYVVEDGTCKLFPADADQACAGGLICEKTPTSSVGEGKCCRPGSAGCKFGLGTEGTFTNLGLGKNTDLKRTIADIINIVLGFLGIVAVIIVMFGGFKWMTAAGNEEQVSQARQLIVGGIIGLVVIFAAWAIASFVTGSLLSATT